MTTVPFLNLQRLHDSIADDLREAIDEVVADAAFIGGERVAAFERDFAAAHGTAGAAGTNSGTDALALGLRALGIGPGDEVIVPSMTFIATAEAVLHTGATPVIVDVDPDTLLIDPEAVRSVTTSRTRAVLPVHLYGNVVGKPTITAWREAGLRVIEDAAQAHLARFADGSLVGTAGDAGAFSFFPGKNLGAFGDAGAVVSADLEIVERVRTLRDHGRRTKYIHDELGYSSRLDGLQAAILSAKLRHLSGWTDGRRAAARRYRELLTELAPDVRLVPWSEGSVHHLFVVRVNADIRDRLRHELASRGVSTGVHYPVPLSKQPVLASLTRSPCPNAETASDELVSLPMDPLMVAAEIDTVSEALLDAVSCCRAAG